MTILQTLADNLAEILVVPSFTRIGFDLRRRLFDWPDAESYPMTGRTVVLTGPTSGLGRAAAGSFARMGARLVLVGRDAGRLEKVRGELLAERPDASIATVVADMASLASVRAAADEILATQPRIDVVVDNAGVIVAQREVTDEGFERTFATMVLGPFVLVSRLLPRLAESPDGRVVAVTSGGMYTQALPVDDLGYEHGEYNGPMAYARAKRAQVALVREWARRLGGRGPAVNAMHPGWAATPGLSASLPGFYERIGDRLRTPAEGVDTILWLAASPEARERSGRLFLDRRERPFDRIPSTRLSASRRRELWARVVELTGERDPLTVPADDRSVAPADEPMAEAAPAA
jgi:NAD(P)-dependent dehydrogenase (short-subunit alcohol dehydrogenase family)